MNQATREHAVMMQNASRYWYNQSRILVAANQDGGWCELTERAIVFQEIGREYADKVRALLCD